MSRGERRKKSGTSISSKRRRRGIQMHQPFDRYGGGNSYSDHTCDPYDRVFGDVYTHGYVGREEEDYDRWRRG